MKLLLLYLDKKGILKNMENACKQFLENLSEKTVIKFPPLRYLMQIDVMDLFELFPELGEHLIKEPLKWQSHCNEILFARLKHLNNDLNIHIKLSQVLVNIRLKCLPHVYRNFKLRTYTGITSFIGLLVNISKPTNYVFHTVWSCPEECEDNEVVLQYIPKSPPKCYVCKSTLFENSGLRMCGDQVHVTFKLKNDLLPKKYAVVDDLVQNLKLGANYYINVVILKRCTAIWGLEETATYPAPPTSLVPRDIEKLLGDCENKPWKFIYRLASSIGLHTCPLNCFVTVKVYLLLSLVSVSANNLCGSPLLHVLATGFDTGYTAELMRQASLLANSNVILGASNCTVGTALLGAANGICIIPLPLHVYNQKQVHSIVSAIETDEIHHDINKVKLNCAIWAHLTDLKKKLYDVARVFGTVCRIDYGEYTDELVDFVLQQAIDPPKATNEEKQSLHDISIYIDLVGGMKVSIGEECKNLLSNYFLAARRERTNAVPIGSMETLVTTCAMSARLCRRSIANIDDAVFAVWLHICSMSDPRIAPEEYLQAPTDMSYFHSTIEKFVGWLEQFTECCIVNV